MKKQVLPVLLVVVLLLCGCMSSFHESMSLSDFIPAAPTLLNSQISPRTAVLVVDPQRVPESFPILVDGKDLGWELMEMQLFVRRDLQKVFRNYFREVIVVDHGSAMPEQPHVVIDIKIDRIEERVTQRIRTSNMISNTGYIAMTWSLAIRPSESGEYLYSFAGESGGTQGTDAALLYRSMLESAITGMLKGYTDKGIQEKIMQLPPPGAIPAAANAGTGV